VAPVRSSAVDVVYLVLFAALFVATLGLVAVFDRIR
jgi:hypothetical protein